MISKQFFRFLLANTLAAVLNIGTRFYFSLFTMDFVAVMLGFVAGLSSSYYLCRGFVFHSTRQISLSEALRFTLVNLFMLLITWSVYQASLMWFEAIWGDSLSNNSLRIAAHTIGVAAPVFVSFAAQKSFTFRQRLR
jgi:putative flippase GtrA